MWGRFLSTSCGRLTESTRLVNYRKQQASWIARSTTLHEWQGAPHFINGKEHHTSWMTGSTTFHEWQGAPHFMNGRKQHISWMARSTTLHEWQEAPHFMNTSTLLAELCETYMIIKFTLTLSACSSKDGWEYHISEGHLYCDVLPLLATVIEWWLMCLGVISF